MEAVVDVRALCFSFADAPLLTDINFRVERGDFLAVTGANGAGKSTLLRLLLGELAPASGGILLFGEDAQHFKRWRRIGYVPQNGAAFAQGFPANALEIVCANLYGEIGPLRFPGKHHRQKAANALRAVGMEERARSLIGELSGGQLQRVLLARALVAQPELLLLDEPSTGVDDETVRLLYTLLAARCRDGMTAVMVTHDYPRAHAYVTRSFCLDHPACGDV